MQGEGVDRTRNPSSLLAAAGGRVQLLLPVLSRLGVLATGEVVAILTPRTVLLNESEVWSTAPVAVTVSLNFAGILSDNPEPLAAIVNGGFGNPRGRHERNRRKTRHGGRLPAGLPARARLPHRLPAAPRCLLSGHRGHASRGLLGDVRAMERLRHCPAAQALAVRHRVPCGSCAKTQGRARVPTESQDAQDQGALPDDHLAAGRNRELLLQALTHIPIERRAVLIMHEVDETPMRDIAHHLGIPLFTAYSRLRRARQELDAALVRLEKGPRRVR